MPRASAPPLSISFILGLVVGHSGTLSTGAAPAALQRGQTLIPVMCRGPCRASLPAPIYDSNDWILRGGSG